MLLFTGCRNTSKGLLLSLLLHVSNGNDKGHLWQPSLGTVTRRWCLAWVHGNTDRSEARGTFCCVSGFYVVMEHSTSPVLDNHATTEPRLGNAVHTYIAYRLYYSFLTRTLNTIRTEYSCHGHPSGENGSRSGVLLWVNFPKKQVR